MIAAGLLVFEDTDTSVHIFRPGLSYPEVNELNQKNVAAYSGNARRLKCTG
jgi:hypothetical protein